MKTMIIILLGLLLTGCNVNKHSYKVHPATNPDDTCTIDASIYRFGVLSGPLRLDCGFTLNNCTSGNKYECAGVVYK